MKKRAKGSENRTTSAMNQRGAVLVFALLLLLVMTVLGVASIGNSVLEERMSGNFYQSNSALQSAEIGLRVAENWLAGLGADTSAIAEVKLERWFAPAITQKGFYSTQRTPGVYTTCNGEEKCGFQPTDENHWCDPDPTCKVLPKGYVTLGDDIDNGIDPKVTLPGIDNDMVARQPRFVIEYIGRSGAFVGNLAMDDRGQPDVRKYAFRITAIGWGRDPNARQVLQSHFLMPL